MTKDEEYVLIRLQELKTHVVNEMEKKDLRIQELEGILTRLHENINDLNNEFPMNF